MRHIRNLMWFIVGILIACAASFSNAANIIPGNYYQSGNNLVRVVSDSLPKVTTTTFGASIPANSPSYVNLTTNVVSKFEGGAVSVAANDVIAAPLSSITSMAETTAAAGFKSGLKGGLGGIAAQVLAGYLVQKGYQWMDAAKCQVTAGCTTPGMNYLNPDGTVSASIFPDSYGSACKARLHSNWDPYISSISVSVSSVVTVPGGIQLQLACSATTISPYAGVRSDNDGYNILQGTSPCGPNYTLNYSTYACDYSGAPTYVPVSPSDLSTAVDDAVKSNIGNIVNAIRSDQTPVSIPDDSVSTATGPSVNGNPTTTKSTTNNPDGSTTTKETTNQNNYNPNSAPSPVKNPAPITITNNVTNKITNCNAAGACSTQTETTDDQSDTVSPTWSDPTMPEQPSLYTQKYADGLSGVWNQHSSALSQTAFMKSLQTLAPSISGGSCPTFAIDTDNGWIKGGSPTIPTPCWVFDFIKACLLLSAAFLCRSIIFGG